MIWNLLRRIHKKKANICPNCYYYSKVKWIHCAWDGTPGPNKPHCKNFKKAN